MNLQEFKFPTLDGISIAFSCVKTDELLLQEAKDRGFFTGSSPYNTLFSSLFFTGGAVTFKSDLNAEFKSSAWKYYRALMASYEPSHEEKEAVCALLMSELLELPTS